MRKFQGFFFHEEFRSDIAEKMCNGQSSLHRASATLVKATGNCNVPHDRVGTARQSQMFASGFSA